jgi:hypothetical protein
VFSGEEEVNKSTILSFFSSNNATFTIDGKCKSVLIEGCKKVKLYIDNVISEVSVMNC